MKLHNFRLDQNGLERLLGKLEARIMSAVWELGNPTVQEVVDHLGKNANYKTIMTVMNRLVSKGFLNRHKVARAYTYTPSLSREELDDRLSRQVLDSLLEDFGPAVITQFVEVIAETDRSRLLELAELVETKLVSRKTDPE